MPMPGHIAIIMDGNGRWAKARRRPRIFGHIRGSNVVRPIVKECGKIGIKYLTLYCFSEENWGRPTQEVSILMRLLEKYLIRERKTLMEGNVRFQTIGNVETLPENVLCALRETERLTQLNSGLVLTFALSYGARQELTSAVKKIAERLDRGELKKDQITEDTISSELFTKMMPDPDLVIRTSGEYRVSNFLLWQLAYSELYFTSTCWPDFSVHELHRAIEVYTSRTRRFGLTDEQLEATL